MITRLTLKNFRSHADTEVPLTPMTLMVGPVGAGKSNVLKGLVLVQNSLHYALADLFPTGLNEFYLVKSRWAEETDPIGFEFDVTGLAGFPADVVARYSLRIADSPHGLYVVSETLAKKAGADGFWEYVFQRRRDRPDMGAFGEVDPHDPTLLCKVLHRKPDVNAQSNGVLLAHAVASAVSSFGYYHLEASQLKFFGDGQAWPRIGYNGTRLPDFFAWIKSNEESIAIYDAILREMQQVLPDLVSIIVTRSGTDRQGLAASFRGHKKGYVTAQDLSDGTVFTLGLLALIYGPQKPNVLCIEEPETGLHPGRLRWLFDRFVKLAYPPAGTAPVQVLLTTHSPYLLDLFSDMPESVVVVEQTAGRTRMTPMPVIRQKLHDNDPSSRLGSEWAAGLFEGL
jgi:predicted ATPase